MNTTRPDAARPARTPLRRLAGAAAAATVALTLGASPALAAPADGGRSVAPAAAPAPKSVGFGVVPATAKDIDKRSFFSYGLAPGSVARDNVAVVNYSAQPLKLDLRTADAMNTNEGGFTLQASDQRPTGLGAWVELKLGTPQLTVPARAKNGQPGKVIVPVTLNVPADAPPGDHGAGIVATLATVGKNPQGQNVRLEQRVAARVYVKVSGPARPELQVSELVADFSGSPWPWESGSTRVTYTIVNSGNVRMGFQPSISVAGPFGLGTRRVQLDPVAELLPHNSQSLTTTVDGVWSVGWLQARVAADPTAAVGAESPQLGQVSKVVSMLALTAWHALVLVLIAGLIVLVILRRRRSGRPKADPTDAAAPSPEPSPAPAPEPTAEPTAEPTPDKVGAPT